MKLQMVGCSHHTASVEVRERLAFSAEQAAKALERWQQQFPHAEAVLLSTCNRTELYTAAVETPPSHHEVAEFLASFHNIPLSEIFDDLFEQSGEGAVRHLFTVAASLDSMVVGEGQIIAQVKQAYELACARRSVGPITHDVFQAALRVAKRVTAETTIHQRRVSIASVAVADFARQIFERFDNKDVLVIGAGETAEETLRYLVDEGAQRLTVVNRNFERAQEVAARWSATPRPWADLPGLMAEADLVVSATGASEPIFTLDDFRRIEPRRFQRTLCVLDLAMPRDFDPAIGECIGVYLYSIDDLRETCEANRRERQREWPAAETIIDEEAIRFIADMRHRASAPTIQRLRATCDELKSAEVQRLLNRLTAADERDREEIAMAFDRLVNKILHLPMTTLRDHAEQPHHTGLIDALKRLFQLRD
ncbi:MAG: glutamyl-tRNA reductase [Planctomycetota bacterium]|nr:MAG: glutamyl-tRNA reductase [Planctomycetota bacterium]